MQSRQRLLTEEFVRNRIVEWLPGQGYIPRKVKTLSEHGCDIIAKRRLGSQYFMVEVKGEPQPKFYYAFLTSALGELIQHVTNSRHCRYGVGLPSSFEPIVRRRIPSVAMKKIGLEFLLVGREGSVKRLTWRDVVKSKA
ncbi:MAG: hypothetical protein JRN67_13800 [Nitrososphaerota archaeon]|nr:hypothetical protein [Nitrososphaerota archaeon]